MFRLACVALVRENLGALPIDTATRWLANTPSRAQRDTPEHRLLELAVTYAEHGQPDELDRELDALEAAFAESGDSDGHAVTLAVGAVAAHARSDIDTPRRAHAAHPSAPGPPQDPLLQFFVGTFDAARAALAGDIEGSLRTIESMPLDRVPPTVRELATRLHVIMLVLAGRAEEAVPIGRSLLQSSNVFVQSIPSMLRWAAGDPSEYLVAAPLARKPPAVPTTLTASSVPPTARSSRPRSAIVPSPTPGAKRWRPRSAAPRFARQCPRRRRPWPAARSSITTRTPPSRSSPSHLARHPLTDARGEAHLRHNLAIAYVTSDTVRERWDDAALGPSHARAQGIARHLLAARDGRLDRHAELGFAVDGRDDVAAPVDSRARGPGQRSRLLRRHSPLRDARDVAAGADPAASSNGSPPTATPRVAPRQRASARISWTRLRCHSSSTFSARCG